MCGGNYWVNTSGGMGDISLRIVCLISANMEVVPMRRLNLG